MITSNVYRHPLNRVIPWLQTLNYLGIFPRESYLPCSGDCPLCGQRIIIYRDDYNSAWLSCKHCNVSEDLLTIAKRILKTDTQGVLINLVANHIIPEGRLPTGDSISRYERTQERKQEKQNLWFKIQSSQSLEDQYLYDLYTHFGFYPYKDKSKWFSSIGKLLTTLNKQDTYLNFGRKKDSIVLVSYSLPGKISGYWIGYKEEDYF